MDVASDAARKLGATTDELYYETPHIDRLVREGVAFSQAYVNPLCSPTRASLLTGKHAARLGFMTATPSNVPTYYNQGLAAPEGFQEQDVIRHADAIPTPQAWVNASTLVALPSGQPQDHGRDEVTLAEALTGYDSAFLGKWHLGGHGSAGYQPHDQGFRELGYFDSGASPYFRWRPLWNRRKLAFPKMRQSELLQGKAGTPTGEPYLTDDLTRQALLYLDEKSQDPTQPFLLFYSHFAVHGPLQAAQEDIDYFETKSTRGFNGHRHATYAAMIRSLDNSVGAIVQKLHETGLDKNTLIVFLTDNGGVHWPQGDQGGCDLQRPLQRGQGDALRGGSPDAACVLAARCDRRECVV